MNKINPIDLIFAKRRKRNLGDEEKNYLAMRRFYPKENKKYLSTLMAINSITSICLHPLLRIQVCLQTRISSESLNYNSTLDILNQTWKKEKLGIFFRGWLPNLLKIYTNTICGFYVKKYFFSIYFPYKKKRMWKHYFQAFLTCVSTSMTMQLLTHPLSVIRNRQFTKKDLFISDCLENGIFKTSYSGLSCAIKSTIYREAMFMAMFSCLREKFGFDNGLNIFLSSCASVAVAYKYQSVSRRKQLHLDLKIDGSIPSIKLYRGILTALIQQTIFYIVFINEKWLVSE